MPLVHNPEPPVEHAPWYSRRPLRDPWQFPVGTIWQTFWSRQYWVVDTRPDTVLGGTEKYWQWTPNNDALTKIARDREMEEFPEGTTEEWSSV